MSTFVRRIGQQLHKKVNSTQINKFKTTALADINHGLLSKDSAIKTVSVKQLCSKPYSQQSNLAKNQLTSISAATIQNETEEAKSSIAAKTDLNIRNKDNYTPLHCAA